MTPSLTAIAMKFDSPPSAVMSRPGSSLRQHLEDHHLHGHAAHREPRRAELDVAETPETATGQRYRQEAQEQAERDEHALRTIGRSVEKCSPSVSARAADYAGGIDVAPRERGISASSTAMTDQAPRRSQRITNAYVALVTTAGIAALTALLVRDAGWLVRHGTIASVIFFSCTIIAELRPLKVVLRGSEGEFTSSIAFAFAQLIVAGPAAAALTLVVGAVVSDLIGRKRVIQVLFNAGQYVIAVVAAAAMLGNLGGDALHPAGPHFLSGDLSRTVLAAVTLYVVNALLVGTVIALANGLTVLRYVLNDFIFQSSTAGLVLGLAPILVITADFSLWALPLLFAPLVAIHRGARAAISSQHQALHDALTGLPNRVLFSDRVEQAVAHVRSHLGMACVMLIDLDHFKEVNDTLGHHQGDHLLREVARILRASLRDGDTVARLGGDEFAVLLTDCRSIDEANTVAAKMLDELRQPILVDEVTLAVGASIGIACYPLHGDDVETLIQRADVAMYVAKESGAGVRLYSEDNDHHSARRLSLAGELRSAVDDDELTLVYQPKSSLESGRVVGVEALVRWKHPRLGLLAPDEFIPLAERTGAIGPLTRWVLERTVADIARWREEGVELRAAINLSVRSLLDIGLAADVASMLARADVAPEMLEIEITESTLMADPKAAEIALGELSDIGVSLAIDDYGTGFTSLGLLGRLPVQTLKIDKSFVLAMSDDPTAETIVRSTIDLGKNLGLQVVAEGVESVVTWQRLRSMGCDVAQGYLISRPLDHATIADFARTAAAGTASWQRLTGTHAGGSPVHALTEQTSSVGADVQEAA
jgi:diguanylate cyclase (GGDEF)-like protein